MVFKISGNFKNQSGRGRIIASPFMFLYGYINGDYVPKRMISGQFVNDTNKIPNSALVYNVNSALTTHKSSADHDGRYYTESEINSKISNLQAQINNVGKSYTQLAHINSIGQSASYNGSAYRFLYVYVRTGGKAFTAFIPVVILRDDQETYAFGAAYSTQYHGIWIEIKLSIKMVTLVDVKNNNASILADVYVNGIN